MLPVVLCGGDSQSKSKPTCVCIYVTFSKEVHEAHLAPAAIAVLAAAALGGLNGAGRALAPLAELLRQLPLVLQGAPLEVKSRCEPKQARAAG